MLSKTIRLSSSASLLRSSLSASKRFSLPQSRLISPSAFIARAKMSTDTVVPPLQTAFIYHPGQFELEQKEIPVPAPAPGHVLLKVVAAGVCHSDLHVLDGSLPYPDGLILGHEVVGTIVGYGDGVSKESYPAGPLFAIHGPNPCGICKHCRTGADNLCQEPTRSHMGLGTPGGYEQYTQVNPRNLTLVPEGISPAVAAVSTDAVLTPYHALKRAKVNGLTRLLIIGLGGLGINGVQVAKAFGAHVTAVDFKESSRELAKSFGADVVYDKLPEESLDVDVVADFVGAQATFDLAQKHVKTAGLIMPVGLGATHLSFDLGVFAFKEFEILGNFWGTSEDQVEVFDLVKKGLVTPQVETTSYLNVNTVLKNLHDGNVKSRMVLVHED